MTSYLLDVSTLVALWWPTHESHDKVLHWFGRNAKAGWATCPFTESAAVRILSNPAFSPDALTVKETIAIVDANLNHPTHQFWPDDIRFMEAIAPFRERIVGHKQVTDAYLLGLAMHRKGKLVTIDRALPALLMGDKPADSYVVVI
ncbi:MAG TPA: TA system VapC family ribonuclease toxin [Candidatus Angelobacter sp.]